MDLKRYFRKIRDIEATIAEAFAFIISLESSDGRKAGVVTEVPRLVAAKMIAEGRAVLASEDDKARFLAAESAKREAAKRADVASRLQVTIVSDSESNGQPTVKLRDKSPERK